LRTVSYELLLLTKSGREIVVDRAENDDDANKLAEAARGLLSALKAAIDNNDVIQAGRDGTFYWILPAEIEGVCLYRVPEAAEGDAED
jgi:hypothetical protein